MNSILETIALRKFEETALAKKIKPQALLSRPAHLHRTNFIKAIQSSPKPAIIAEIKKASPSKGVIREHFDPVQIAISYSAHGACCLSVLTDVDFFQGHPDYIAQVKAHTKLPVLRKDFIVDPYQIHESWALGADCILLIVALLTDAQLEAFCLLAQELDLAVLVESHSKEELERAIRLPTPLIGINNRSLHDFNTNIQTSIDLKRCIPDEKIAITESGIHSREDILRMQSNGIDVFLVGESLMRADDVGLALDHLMGQF